LINKRNKQLVLPAAKKRHLLLIPTLLLAACSGLPSQQGSQINSSTLNPLIANQYNPESAPLSSAQTLAVLSEQLWIKDGLGNTDNAALNRVMQTALAKHPTIIENEAIVKQAQQQVIITSSDNLLSVSLAGSVSKSTSSASSSPSNSANLALNGSIPLDVWGNLSASSKAAQYQLSAAQAQLALAKRTLVADISKAWYRLVYNQLFLTLKQKQRDNSATQLATIESSYHQGLSAALDVYLARQNIETAKVALIAAKRNTQSASRTLETLLSLYPSGQLTLDSPLPTLSDELQYPLGIPADLLANRADLNSSWLAVLAQDATVASRYAARFPQFSLSGDISLSSTGLANLFSENLAWSLLTSVGQSLIDNGKNKALYEQAKARLIEQEQQYLQVLRAAFNEVETLLSDEHAIRQQWSLTKLALKNSQLAFDHVSLQYQNGLSTYQQVLDIQDRLFSQQQAELELQLSLVDNRINLILALGTSEITPQVNGQ
jgi:NodT family efflux transporter outer membrane factor (OMF) lipoprotein